VGRDPAAEPPQARVRARFAALVAAAARQGRRKSPPRDPAPLRGAPRRRDRLLAVSRVRVRRRTVRTRSSVPSIGSRTEHGISARDFCAALAL
jgi:hypothetical protein